MTKKSRQKLKYLENEKSFSDEVKCNFHLFGLKYLENEKSFSGEIKCNFNLFLRAFIYQKLSQTLECAFLKNY